MFWDCLYSGSVFDSVCFSPFFRFMKPVNSFIFFLLSCATSDINIQCDEGSQYLVEEAEVPYDALHIITSLIVPRASVAQ